MGVMIVHHSREWGFVTHIQQLQLFYSFRSHESVDNRLSIYLIKLFETLELKKVSHTCCSNSVTRVWYIIHSDLALCCIHGTVDERSRSYNLRGSVNLERKTLDA